MSRRQGRRALALRSRPRADANQPGLPPRIPRLRLRRRGLRRGRRPRGPGRLRPQARLALPGRPARRPRQARKRVLERGLPDGGQAGGHRRRRREGARPRRRQQRVCPGLRRRLQSGRDERRLAPGGSRLPVARCRPGIGGRLHPLSEDRRPRGHPQGRRPGQLFLDPRGRRPDGRHRRSPGLLRPRPDAGLPGRQPGQRLQEPPREVPARGQGAERPRRRLPESPREMPSCTGKATRG